MVSCDSFLKLVLKMFIFLFCPKYPINFATYFCQCHFQCSFISSICYVLKDPSGKDSYDLHLYTASVTDTPQNGKLFRRKPQYYKILLTNFYF